jgi:heme oxygenase (mycobilin-producing)
MSVVVINAVTVPEDHREQFETAFAGRAGQVSNAPGFEAFELMRPSEGGRYLVYTRWATIEDFQAWRSSASFGAAHRDEGSGAAARNTSEVWTFEVLQGEYAG